MKVFGKAKDWNLIEVPDGSIPDIPLRDDAKGYTLQALNSGGFATQKIDDNDVYHFVDTIYFEGKGSGQWEAVHDIIKQAYEIMDNMDDQVPVGAKAEKYLFVRDINGFKDLKDKQWYSWGEIGFGMYIQGIK